VGFPIRKSADQSFFAAPRGLSQRSTSFIASQRQGIHRMPLGHLIALIINAHPLGSGSGRAFDERFDRLALNRKTSLLRIVPTACGQAADIALATRSHARRFSSPCDVTTFNARRLRIDRDMCRARLSERSYLFTMSDITHPRAASRLAGGCERRSLRTSQIPAGGARRDRTDDLLLAKQALSQLSYGPAGDQ
jgi:hypothetical protein